MKHVTEVHNVTEALQCIKEQTRVAESNPLFIEFLAKETGLEEALLREYAELYHRFVENNHQKARTGDRAWTIEEKMLLKFFYNHLKDITTVKNIIQSFSQINERTIFANNFHFYNNRTFYQEIEKKQKKKVHVAHLRPATSAVTDASTPKELPLSSCAAPTSPQQQAFAFDEPPITETIPSELAATTTIPTSNDTLLVDLQQILKNTSQLPHMDIAGLFSGLAALTTLAVQQTQKQEAIRSVKASNQQQADQLHYLENKLRETHAEIARFSACDSVYKITKLNDFLEELTKKSKFDA